MISYWLLVFGSLFWIIGLGALFQYFLKSIINFMEERKIIRSHYEAKFLLKNIGTDKSIEERMKEIAVHDSLSTLCEECNNKIKLQKFTTPKGKTICSTCYQENYYNKGTTNETMHDKYGDGSDHKVCSDCGLCKHCNDCKCQEDAVSEPEEKNE